MPSDYDVHESAYYSGDGEEAYLGMDAYMDEDDYDEELDDDYNPEDNVDRNADDDFAEDDEDEDEDEDDNGDEGTGISLGRGGGEENVLTGLQGILQLSGDRITQSATVMNQLGRILAIFHPDLGLIPPTLESSETQADDERTPPQRRRQSARERYKPKEWWKKPHTEPQKAGVELLMSGEFGRVGPKYRERGFPGVGGGSRNLATLLRQRASSTRPIPKEEFAEGLVPNSSGTVVASYPANVYCGQFSADSSFYYVCRKDFNLHVYDMTAPQIPGKTPNLLHYDNDSGHRTTMKVLKTIKGIPEGWTITDSHLSPDNERMIYSSMCSVVYMVKTLDYETSQTAINFGEGRQSNRNLWGWDDDSYCIWSCRFSADGNEVIAGGRGKIFVYDLLANRRTVKISAHDDDVNSCCWADEGSNVLISASDDSFIKVWDRRSLGSSRRPSGVLIGHTEGITNVSAKGDGRYVISNGKDQALRLWDLRKMRTNEEYEQVKNKNYGLPGFDYRYSDDRAQQRPAHPKDCSVMTYRGHMVMRTLIRCHFSPAETTGSAYIYSGSRDGRVHIWSLDGRLVQVLDRSKTLPISFDPSGPELSPQHRRRNGFDCVRDVSWHSKEPVLLSAAWSENENGNSTVARHEWKGLSKMNGRLEDWVSKQNEESQELERQAARGPRRSQRLIGRVLPGAYEEDDDY